MKSNLSKLLEMSLEKDTENQVNFKIELKETEIKGMGLYATQVIKKGEIIAYYKMKVYKIADYNYPYGGTYIFNVYRKNGEDYKRLVGDIYSESFPKSKNNIPYWAPFVNEPNDIKNINCEIDVNLKETYRNKNALKPGSVIIYFLVATKNIQKGQEITWYYGDKYERNYTVKV